MTPTAAAALGQAILALHLAVIAFNVLGLAAIPLGAAMGWGWVRVRWWRALHLASWAVVAVQALLGRACFLTLWQDQLTGVIYWPLPIWAFAAAYIALFAAVVALWWIVPPNLRNAPAE